MTDPLDSALDPSLVDLLSVGQRELADLERTLSPHEFHRCGLDLFVQGYSAQAELCLRFACRTALAKNDYTLWRVASLDLVRSLIDRNPKLALGILSQIKPAELDRNLLSLFHNELAQSVAALCRFEIAGRYYQNSMSIASAHANWTRVAHAMANISTLKFIHGAYAEARKLNAEALAILNDSDQLANVGLLLNNMFVNTMHEGDYDEAGGLFERLIELCNETGNVRLCAFALTNGGELNLITGNHESAHQLLRQAERQAAIAALPVIQAQALILRTLVEQGLSTSALRDAAASCAKDLYARELENQSLPLAVIAASLAASEGRPFEPYLTSLNSSLVSLAQTRLMLEHYKRLLRILEERRRALPVQSFPKFITQASIMTAVKDKLNRLLGSNVRILIEGETGTGKSFLARQFHDANGRPNSPFIIVDCTNLEENLFESKLFGHLRGSFTGAVSDTVGLVEQANGGTLFLDEIGELPTEIQGKLLYTIEEQRYRPVGAKQERRSEFRLIAATNRDIDRMLDGGKLRKDLFFRIAGFRVTLPPLRDRREDIIPLADLKLEQLNRKYRRQKSLRADAWEALVQYAWPGNVRELNTALERGYHLSVNRRMSLDDLGLGLSPDGLTQEDLSWYSVRREHLLRVLKLCRGNVAKAAQLLGLNRTTLIYKLKLLNIERKDFAPVRHTAEQRLTRESSDLTGRQPATRAGRGSSGEDQEGDYATA